MSVMIFVLTKVIIFIFTKTEDYENKARKSFDQGRYSGTQNVNSFHANGLFRYPLKTSENQRFSDVFKGYQKRPVA